MLIALTWANSTWASSSGVLQGRLWLTESNLPSAYQAFSAAVADEPADDEARVLKTLSALALLQKNATITNYIQGFHISSPTNIWLVRDQGYRTNANAPTPYRTEPALSSTQGVTILTNVILPVLFQAESDLAGITNTNVLVPLGRAETGLPDITLDYGDILMIRSLVASGISATYLVRSQNTATLFNDIFDLEEAPGPATIELWLQHFPDFAKSAYPQNLPLSRTKAQDALVLYTQASTWIRTYRTPDQVRLFNLPGSFGVRLGTFYTASLAEEELFRSKLNEYAAGLNGPVLVTGSDERPIDTFDAKPFFDGQRDLRLLTPPFRKNKIRQGSITDATFGGIWTTNTQARLEGLLLQETSFAAFDPYAFGLFVPPSITLETPPHNALAEDFQPHLAFLGLGSVWTKSPNRYQDFLNLFWINPTTTEVSRLFAGSIDAGWGWIQEAKLSGDTITMIINEWSPESMSTVYRVNSLNISTGILFDGPMLVNDPDFWIYSFLISTDDIFILGWSNPVGYLVRKVNRTTGLITDLSPINSGYQGGTFSLYPSGNVLFLVFYGYDEATGTWGYILNRISGSNGTSLSHVPLAGEWPYLNKISPVSDSLAYGIRTTWSESGEILQLYSLDFQTGIISQVSPSLLPSGRFYSWNSFQVTSDGQNAHFQSHNGGWNNFQLHKVRLVDGELLSSQHIGGPDSNVYFSHLFETPGRFLYAKRSGDLSENISLQLSISGTAQGGADFVLSDTNILLPSGNVEHPIRFNLIDDSSKEFAETASLQGSVDPASEASFQPFSLTILDNDGFGVGIFATDNQGKEGRMNPDPFGFRFGVYNPVRYEVRRTGPTTSLLSVKVNRDLLLSSATPDDYEIQGFDVDGQTVRIQAGQSAAEIIISPKYDSEYPEGTESLVFKVSPDSAYALTENISASATILDSSLYEWWSYQMGLLVSNQPPTLDIDGDGLPNLLEMALGRDPNLPDAPGSTQQSRDPEGYMTLAFKRWSGGTTQVEGAYVQYGVTYQPQATSSLENPASWSSNSIEIQSVMDTGDGMELVTVRDTLSKTFPSRFLRLKVTLSE